MLKSSLKKIVNFFSVLKHQVYSAFFKRSPKKKIIFETIGYIFLFYHLGMMGRKWYKHRKVHTDLNFLLKKHTIINQQQEGNWVVLMVTDSKFNMDNEIVHKLASSGFSIFFSK